MATSSPGKVNLSDLRPLINVMAEALPERGQVSSIRSGCSGLRNVRLPSRAGETQIWRAVFEAALEARPETLASLLKVIGDEIGDQWQAPLQDALREVGRSCVSRITREANSTVDDEAEKLLQARTVPEMDTAAQNLRQTALDARQLLMRPLITDAYLQIAPSVLDPEQRRMELADLAVDVVTAVDYLISLLGRPSTESPKLVLSDEAGADRGHGVSDEEAADRLTRRRLDARSTAVRLGMRLLSGLRSDVASR